MRHSIHQNFIYAVPKHVMHLFICTRWIEWCLILRLELALTLEFDLALVAYVTPGTLLNSVTVEFA